MATVQRENLGTPLHDKITVKLVKDDYMPAFEKTLKQYAKTANIPGFRKGMVPAGMLRKMAGQSIFNEEVIRSASRELEEFMKSEQLLIFGQPMIMPDGSPVQLDVNKPGDVELAFEIGIKPDFEIPAIKHRAAMTAYKIVATSDEIEKSVLDLQERFGTTIDKEEINLPGDMVTLTSQQSDADGNAEPGAEAKTINSKVSDFPVKMQEMLTGKIPGSVLVVRPDEVCTEEELPKFVRNVLKETMAEAGAYFSFTVTKAATIMPAELNAELFMKVFPADVVTDETTFREQIKAEIQRQYDKLCRDRYHEEIFELLVHDTPVQLPVTFLKRWMKEGGEHPKTELEVDQEFGSFEHQLRWQLISDKLITEQGLNVSLEDVKGEIKRQVLGYYGMDEDDDAPWMEPYLAKAVKDEKMMDETYRRMVTDRLFGWLENQFNTELKEITLEEYAKLPSAHAAHHRHHH